MLENIAEDTGMMDQGEIFSFVQKANAPPIAVQSETNDQISTVNVNKRGRGRGRRLFYRNTGENDVNDMHIAPLKIFENQVIPIGRHNLSKSFRPNLSTIRVLSLGTKFIPRWKFEKRNDAFKKVNDTLRRMNNKMYCMETRPGVFEKNPKLKLTSNFMANTQYREIEAFGWRIHDYWEIEAFGWRKHDRISDAIQSMI